ncbi:hypothetical protein JW992_02390 [candidate division KSB1 bacterium]|nr:hypothetical protein [candidate division KSB1 bacterium]
MFHFYFTRRTTPGWWLLILLGFGIPTPETIVGCTVGIVGGRATIDGRPLLWKNRDSSFRDNEVAFFRGPRYDFIGIINADDTTQVWMGVNTAGFAVMNSESLDQPGDSIDTEGFFMKKALGLCGDLQDFEKLLQATNQAPGRGTRSNFGCIDAFGQAAFFETGNRSFVRIDTRDPVAAPAGALVRANFSMTGRGDDNAYGTWRFHRARKLFDQAINSGRMDHRFILQKTARDLVLPDIDPYPLPFVGRQGIAPEGAIKTQESINRHRTVSCAVFHGVKPGEAPGLTTLWVILGEPVAGIAVPLWPVAGTLAELDGKGGSELNRRIQAIESELYPYGRWPNYIDTKKLVGSRTAIQPDFHDFEAGVFSATERALQSWRLDLPDLQTIRDFQTEQIRRVLRFLR